MRQDTDGRDTLPTGCDTYAYGDKVVAIHGGHAGKIVAVGKRTVSIMWTDGDFPVVYPTNMIRRALPWE